MVVVYNNYMGNSIGMHAFFTPCSNGVVIGNCPYSTNSLDFIGEVLNLGSYFSELKDLPIQGPKGCIECPFSMREEEIQELEKLVV